MKKIIKALALCFVVAVFAICGLAGCGKNSGDPVTPTGEGQSEVYVKEYTKEDLEAYLVADGVVARFVDGYKFSLKTTALFGLTPAEYYITGNILLFARGVEGEFNCHITMLDKTEIDIEGYVRDEKIYARTSVTQNLWAEQEGPYDYDPAEVKEQIEGVFDIVDRMLTLETSILTDLFAVLTSNTSSKTKVYSDLTGNVTYTTILDGLVPVSATFNKYNELIDVKMLGTVNAAIESYMTINIEAMDHSTRIDFPENLDSYIDMTDK